MLDPQPCALRPLDVQASPFWDVHAFGCVQSTNEVVKAAMREGMAEGFCATALEQSGGYGRQGRTWVSPQGGLYTSFALRPNLPPAQLPTLSLVVSLACADALEQACPGLHPLIKWPNDVLCERGKLVGISLEALAGGVCVGVGVNLFQPQDTQAVSGKYRQAYVFEGVAQPGLSTDQRARATQVLELMLQEVRQRYSVWRSVGFAAFYSEYSRRFAYRGKRATLSSVDGATCIEGTIEGVDDQGRILVNDGANVVPMASGEVHITALG